MVPCDTLIKVHAQQASELYRMVEDLSKNLHITNLIFKNLLA